MLWLGRQCPTLRSDKGRSVEDNCNDRHGPECRLEQFRGREPAFRQTITSRPGDTVWCVAPRTLLRSQPRKAQSLQLLPSWEYRFRGKHKIPPDCEAKMSGPDKSRAT